MLLLLSTLYLLSFVGCDVPQTPPILSRHPRIVGGQPADIRDAPYQVALLFASSGTAFAQTCGGSIVRANAVVSAAHCTQGTTAPQWRARAGSTQSASGGQLKEVSRITNHPNYNQATVDNDICVFILSSPITLDGTLTRVINLPAQGAAVADGAMALVTGWGSTVEGGPPSDILRKITIPIVNQRTCEIAYNGVNTVTARMICAGLYEAGGQSTCQRDSGGPLAINGVLIGITSWGTGCGLPKFPGVYTRVPSFRTWIDQQV